MYKILEAHAEYKDGQLCRVTVLVEISKGDVRAIFCTNEVMNGYDMIKPGEPINENLLQRCAGYGRGMLTGDRDKIFRNWKKKHYGSKR